MFSGLIRLKTEETRERISSRVRRTRLKIVNVNEDEEIMLFKMWICKNNRLASDCTGNPCYSCEYIKSL